MNFKEDLSSILQAFKNVYVDGVELAEDSCYELVDAADFLNNKTEIKGFYAMGITKFVYLPKNKDYVIKVPFNGTGEWRYSAEIDEDIVEFSPFEGAMTSTISGEYTSCWNYCEKEACLYRHAEKAGVEEMFAKTQFFATAANGYPIYASERAESVNCAKNFDDIYNNKEKYIQLFNDFVTKNLKGNTERVPEKTSFYFLGYMIFYYGEERFNDLLDFIFEMGIDDLHNDNVGFIGEKPVIIDYSGFNF